MGDRLKVHFKNLDPNAPHSMHFHGVEYHADFRRLVPARLLRPRRRGAYGETFTYELTAGPDSAGVWSYHDHGPAMEDAIAGGMYGALSILGRGERAADREFVVFFTALKGFETVNGRAFVGNTPVFKARVGDIVQWDVLTLGDEMHTFHVHGHRWRRDGVPEDTRSIGPAESFKLRWKENAPGTWLYHCHFEAHMMQGMIGLYRVTPMSSPPGRPVTIPGKLFSPAEVDDRARATASRGATATSPPTTSAAQAFASPSTHPLRHVHPALRHAGHLHTMCAACTRS